MIRYIENRDIDRAAYDNCIAGSSFDIIYAYSWYLDCVSPGWDALIMDDYQAVMPLPHRKKMGMPYIYTPLFVQQLGIFSKEVTASLITDFVEHLPPRFRLVDIKGHEQMKSIPENLSYRLRTNYVLDLEKDYPQTSKKYNRNCRRKLIAAEQAHLTFTESLSTEEFITFIGRNLGDQLKELSRKNLDLLAQVTSEGIRRNRTELTGVKDPNSALVAVASFYIIRDRIIFSVCASSKTGKKSQAMSFLVDQQIRRYAGKLRHFDFSGSEIKGVAYFNSTFGARKISYPLLQINRLNWVERMITGKHR